MGGACGAPRLLGIYLISKMHTKTIQKIQKAYIKTYEEDVKIYKDIENSQGQGAFFLKTPVSFRECPSKKCLCSGKQPPQNKQIGGREKARESRGP